MPLFSGKEAPALGFGRRLGTGAFESVNRGFRIEISVVGLQMPIVVTVTVMTVASRSVVRRGIVVVNGLQVARREVDVRLSYRMTTGRSRKVDVTYPVLATQVSVTAPLPEAELSSCRHCERAGGMCI